MKLTNSKIKSIIFMLTLLTSTFAVTTSCKKDDVVEDKTTSVVDTYKGVYADSDGNQSLNYQVVVTKVDNTTIKIKPEGADATVFEADVIAVNGNGNVSCSASNAQAIAFTKSGDVMTLTYAIGGTSSETFVGEKQ